MSKARDLADLISAGNPLADGSISVSEISDLTATATELNYNDITTLGTVEASKVVTADVNGDVTFPDNGKAIFGDSDLEIYHDGSNSYIDELGTGRLYIRADAHITLQNSAGTETYANFASNGAVGLRYDNSTKLTTSASGIDVTGTVNTTGLDATNIATDTITVGNNDTGNAGVLYLYGGATGEGGELRIYPSAAEDTVIDNWSIDVATDDLRFFTNSGTVAYQLAPTGAVSFGSNNYGTSGQVLTSGGSGAAPTWADAGGGGAWELLNTVTASGASYLSMTSGIQAGYDYYVAIVDDFRSSTSSATGYLETTHNGSSWNASNWYYQYAEFSSSTRSYSYGGSQAIWGSNLGYSGSTAPQQWAQFRIEFFNPRNTDTVKVIKVTGSSYSGFATIVVNGIDATLISTDTANAIQGFRLFTNSGNVSGTIKLYGVKSS